MPQGERTDTQTHEEQTAEQVLTAEPARLVGFAPAHHSTSPLRPSGFIFPGRGSIPQQVTSPLGSMPQPNSSPIAISTNSVPVGTPVAARPVPQHFTVA